MVFSSSANMAQRVVTKLKSDHLGWSQKYEKQYTDTNTTREPFFVLVSRWRADVSCEEMPHAEQFIPWIRVDVLCRVSVRCVERPAFQKAIPDHSHSKQHFSSYSSR